MAADNVPITGLDELDAHLDSLIEDPSLDIQRALFDHVELQLTESNIPSLIPRFLPKITEILKAFQQDPAVLCSLAIRLLDPLTLTQVLSLASEDALILAMRSPAPSANLLAISVLAKGARSPGDAAILAVMKPLMTSFVTQWLSSPYVEVGERASRVLGSLLETDCEHSQHATSSPSLAGSDYNANSAQTIATRASRPPGQGLMWRRIFQDRDIYGLILAYCSTRQPSPSLDEKQRTLAQGRVLRILPRLAALNLVAVSRSDLNDLYQQFSTTITTTSTTENSNEGRSAGLLQFAALHMIDKEDQLMQLSLVDFFETLVSIQATLPYSAYRTDTLKSLIAQATAQDDGLHRALSTLPERTVPEEAEELGRFLRTVL
ncbi:uncharacterized protein B0I36DRAFT_240252 [Microdochium trichocladiopsis]|uniref:DNA mismatch repair protein HSM3 N-terminal domain-containing protein n=1 Tax=Microdochium trichocladiopsis TaxID=1682393 RepID=A0A9P8Y9Y3_9PEZI|nr:uncharacterized protein B0I36DRAFT_240252 [Microdochium trichocladiopsis]KAH7035764.1 hypothetical protein B0I36DRAFT_240252 [Microdochium trichocladiopsis]